VGALLAGYARRPAEAAEPEFWTVGVSEESHHLVLETDRFKAVFVDINCKRPYGRRFRVQVSGETGGNRPIQGNHRLHRMEFSAIRRRGRDQAAHLKMDDETLAQLPAGGTTVVIGKQQFDITAKKKRTLIVDPAGRVRESDLVLRFPTPEEFTADIGLEQIAHFMHQAPNHIHAARVWSGSPQVSAADLQRLLWVFQESKTVKEILEKALQQRDAADSEPLQKWLGVAEMVRVDKQRATDASADVPSEREDKYAEDHDTTSSDMSYVVWRNGAYRGKLVVDITEIASPVPRPLPWSERDFYGSGPDRPTKTDRGVRILFEGIPRSYLWGQGVSSPIPVFRGDAPHARTYRFVGDTQDVAFSYVDQVTRIHVLGGPFGQWEMMITDGGKKLTLGETTIDLSGPKKNILFKFDGTIKVSEEAKRSASNVPQSRTWTSTDGRFTVKARLVKSSDGAVTLKKDNGEEIRVPIEKPSRKDQDYVRSHKGEHDEDDQPKNARR